MGHFSQTCLLSHLPIVGGTPIRVCLLTSSPYAHSDRHGDEWFFRSIPFRANYNGYGSIENTHPEDRILVDLALSQFNRDAIEIPQGDNPYHDPPVTRGMPAEGWWDALWEGRLQVRDPMGKPLRVGVPKGTPSWRKVKKLTDRAVAKGKLIPGTVVNRIAYGIVRVTYHGDYQKRYEWHKAIRPVLERRYKVTEWYEHGLKYHEEMVAAADKLGEDPVVRASLDVWFEITPKSGPYPPVNPAREIRDGRLLEAIVNDKGRAPEARRVCHIAWAFIREDVWQAVIPLGGPNNHTGWVDNPTVEGRKAILKERITRITQGGAPWREITSLRTLHGMEGVDSQVRDMIHLLKYGCITQAQGDRVLQAVAEFSAIQSVMSTVCIAPHPTHGGPQDGAWEAHVAFHNALTPVVLNADPYLPEEGEESDGEWVDPSEPVVTDYFDVDIEHF